MSFTLFLSESAIRMFIEIGTGFNLVMGGEEEHWVADPRFPRWGTRLQPRRANLLFDFFLKIA